MYKKNVLKNSKFANFLLGSFIPMNSKTDNNLIHHLYKKIANLLIEHIIPNNFLPSLYIILFISFVLFHNSILGKPFDEDWMLKEFPGVTNTGISMPVIGGGIVNININTNTVRKINPGLFGNNAAVWDADARLLNATMKSRLKQVNISVFRFPGGSTSDEYHWDGNYPPWAVSKGAMGSGGISCIPCCGPGYNCWAVDTYEFLTLCEELNIPHKMFTANHGYCYYDSVYDGPKPSYVSNAARLAANWVEYCNNPDDGSNPNGGTNWAAVRAGMGHSAPFNVKYWEIGNEVGGSWEVGYDPVGTDYGTHFVAFYDAMKAVDPSIHIGLVCGTSSDSARTWTANVFSVPGVADRVDFLIDHTYFRTQWGSGVDDPPEYILSADYMLDDIIADLDYYVQNYTTRTDISYAITEYNTTLKDNHHTIELTSGLFITKVLGRMAELGFGAATLWDVWNGLSDFGGENVGTHGFTSGDHPGVPDHTPYPSYYPFYFYTRNFGDRLINSSSDNPGVRVFASKFSGTNIGIIIINEGPVNHTARINLNINSGADVNAWVLTGDSLTSKKIFLNNQTNDYPAGGPLDVSAVPPYYTEFLRVAPFFINIEKYSVTSLVLKLDSKIIIENETAMPSIITNEKDNLVLFQLEASISGSTTVANVTIDLSSIGGSSNTKMINMSGDSYRFSFLMPAGISKGTYILPVKVIDSAGETDFSEIILTIKSIVAISEINISPSQIINSITNIVIFMAKVSSKWADVTNVTIDLSSIGGSSFTPLNEITIFGITNYSYTNLIPAGHAGGEFELLVTAYDASNNYGTANIMLKIIDNLPPSTPLNLSAVPDKEKVELEWDPSEDETGIADYMICRGTEQGEYPTTNFAGNKTTWEDTFVEGGETYYYTVTAIDTSGNESLPSEEKEASVPSLEGLVQIRPNYIRIVEGDAPRAEIYIEVMQDNSQVEVDVYDIYGKHIRNVYEGPHKKEIIRPCPQWNLDDKFKKQVPTGIYIAIIKINDKIERRKILIIR